MTTDDEETASTIYERRRVGKVTLYEVDSAALFRRRKVNSGEEWDWVWPAGMPRVDAIMICYDAGDASSVDGIEDLCGTSTSSCWCGGRVNVDWSGYSLV